MHLKPLRSLRRTALNHPLTIALGLKAVILSALLLHGWADWRRQLPVTLWVLGLNSVLLSCLYAFTVRSRGLGRRSILAKSHARLQRGILEETQAKVRSAAVVRHDYDQAVLQVESNYGQRRDGISRQRAQLPERRKALEDRLAALCEELATDLRTRGVKAKAAFEHALARLVAINAQTGRVLPRCCDAVVDRAVIERTSRQAESEFSEAIDHVVSQLQSPKAPCEQTPNS